MDAFGAKTKSNYVYKVLLYDQQIMYKSKRDFQMFYFYYVFLQFLLPCSIRGFKKDETIGHYFTVTVNMEK